MKPIKKVTKLQTEISNFLIEAQVTESQVTKNYGNMAAIMDELGIWNEKSESMSLDDMFLTAMAFKNHTHGVLELYKEIIRAEYHAEELRRFVKYLEIRGLM